jgi:hypothetical protein
MESKIRINQYIHNFAISEQGDIYTWLPLPNPKLKNEFIPHLFPRLLSFKLPNNSQILGISTSTEKPEILILNEKKEVLCFNLFTSEPSRKKLTLSLKGKTVTEIKTTFNLDSLLILTNDQTTIFYKSKNSILSNGNYSTTKEYEEAFELECNFKGKINAAAVTNNGYAVVTENKKLSLFGNISFYTKHVRSSANKFAFDFDKNPRIKDIFFTEKNILFINESNEIYVNSEVFELKKTIHLTPRYAYKNFGFALSDLNNPFLNDHFIVSADQQVYLLNKDQDLININPIKINLNPGEKIIKIQNLFSYFTLQGQPTAFALTNHGNVYGFGENDKFQVGIGRLSTSPLMDAVILNPYFNKELDSDFFLSLVEDVIRKNDDISSLFEYIPNALKTNEDLIIKLMISSNFNKSLHRIFEINYDLLLKFITIRPDLKYSFLNFSHNEFIDKTKISSLSKIFPDIVFLYHKEEIPVNTFETLLAPLLSSFKDKLISPKDINQLSGNIYKYGFLSSNVVNPLKEINVNFHLALIRFGFQYDFIDYKDLAIYIFDKEKEQSYFLSLPQIIQEKVQETCAITDLPKNSSMNDLVFSLVKLELITLSERLITKGLIPKAKFHQLFLKSPKMFTPRFNSFLLATPNVDKSSKKTEFNFFGVSTIYSFDNETYFYDGDLLCVTGDEPEGLTNNRIVRHRKPFFFDDYIKKVTKGKIIMFAANNQSFIFINEHQKIFLGGRILRFLELARPKEGEELVELFDMSSRIKLNKDERVQKVLLPTEKTVVILTSQSRVILVYKKILGLLASNRNQNEFDGQDITPLLTLKDNESIKEIVGIDDDHLVYFTTKNNLFLFSKGTTTKIKIVLALDEDIVSIKLGGIGLLGMTNKGRLFMSEITIVETYKIQSWNKLYYAPNPPHDLITKPQPFSLDNIQFPLEKEEYLLRYDVFHQHAAMVTNQGRVFLWGNNAQGALGTRRFKYTHILDLAFLKKDEKVVNVFLGFQKTYLITNKNRLFSFGANRSGSLGDGTEVDRYEPVDLTNKFKR